MSTIKIYRYKHDMIIRALKVEVVLTSSSSFDSIRNLLIEDNIWITENQLYKVIKHQCECVGVDISKYPIFEEKNWNSIARNCFTAF